MKLSEFIEQAKSLFPNSDPEVVLYNCELDIELRTDVDADVWQFELLRGENELVVEFD